MNGAMVGLSAVAGLLIARLLGPEGRGQYAGVVAWFGVALVAGELGQPASVCYHVASDPEHGRDYVTTSRALMLGSGVITAIIGWFVAPYLARNVAALTAAYRLMFLTCIASYVGASFVFALQARAITLWNITRLLQPALYLASIILLALTERLTVLNAVIALATTVLVQTATAWLLCGRVDLLSGSLNTQLARPLLRYGGSQIAASAPTVLNARLDQVILASYAPYRILGLYAVAVSIMSLALPLITAIGDVIFPRIARLGSSATRALQRRALRVSLLAGATMMLVTALTVPFLLPHLLGHAYDAAVPLVWVLCGGGIFLASGQVMGDLLRGRGQPLAVAVGQGIGIVLTVTLLVALLPIWGAMGAAVASTVAYIATFIALRILLERPSRAARQPALAFLMPEPDEAL
jgi:O-antigen/teichoic acid export membrane protein